jgi:hypothetical protein
VTSIGLPFNSKHLTYLPWTGLSPRRRSDKWFAKCHRIRRLGRMASRGTSSTSAGKLYDTTLWRLLIRSTNYAATIWTSSTRQTSSYCPRRRELRTFATSDQLVSYTPSPKSSQRFLRCG